MFCRQRQAYPVSLSGIYLGVTLLLAENLRSMERKRQTLPIGKPQVRTDKLQSGKVVFVE